jgi:hypothetical protein
MDAELRLLLFKYRSGRASITTLRQGGVRLVNRRHSGGS